MDGVTDDQISVSLDLTGLKCPLPVLKARRQIGQMTSGILEVKVDDPAAPRHLLRLWLSLPGDRQLPPVFASRYGSITVGDRGGIVVG